MAPTSSRASLWAGLLCGLVFGLGLGVSQMVDPRKVFLPAMVAGAGLQRWQARRRAGTPAPFVAR